MTRTEHIQWAKDRTMKYVEPGDPAQTRMLLRDYFAAQVVSAVFHGVFEDWRQNKAGIQEDWPTGIAVDAYRIADAMLKIREAT